MWYITSCFPAIFGGQTMSYAEESYSPAADGLVEMEEENGTKRNSVRSI